MQTLKSWISQCKSPGCPLPHLRGPVEHQNLLCSKTSPQLFNQTEQCKKVQLSSWHTWTVIPNGTHQSGVWSPVPGRSPAQSLGVRLFSQCHRHGLPASLPNLTQLQQNYSQQWLQHSLGFSTGKGHLGAAVPDPSHSHGFRGAVVAQTAAV